MIITKERPQGETGWKKVRIGDNHFIEVRPLDLEILIRMPSATKTFLQVGPIEHLLNGIKELFNLGKNSTL
ncbi:MAG: hypothetical protein M0P61_18270 [Ignavibacteriaceae bacterium]|nr:hypothetical protein [Ignavibacteriaceae bacterium]